MIILPTLFLTQYARETKKYMYEALTYYVQETLIQYVPETLRKYEIILPRHIIHLINIKHVVPIYKL